MHEQHQVQKLINDIVAEARGKGIPKVTELTVVMGDLLGFDEGSVRLYFEMLGEGTLLEGARISFRKVPGELHCPKCRKDFLKKGSALNCPVCGTQGIPTEKGKEFFAETSG
jgi:hydrogenase nickel incorporation protein HypA/HybF